MTAVGDPCQAIYGWRGASVANLDDFPEHFAHADGRRATRQSLSENRRSGGRLLDLANGLAEPLRAMHAGVEALRPAPGAERDGMVRCALLNTHAEEIDWIADSIAHLVRTGKAPGEIAVLCRTATDFAEIQGALVARDIPVEVVGLSGLLHLPEVADLVAVCEVLQDPGANASLVRLLTGPRWRIGPRDLALLGRRARLLVSHARVDGDDDPDRRLAAAVEGVDPSEVISLADALDTFLEMPLEAEGADDGLPFSPDARVRFARLAAELRDLRRSLADPLMDVLHRVLAVTGLEVELSASPHALAARRRETLSNFLDIAASFAANSDGEATPARLPRLPAHGRPVREGPRQRAARRREHRQGAHRAQVQGPGVGRRRRPRPGHRHLPQHQGREKWTAQGKVLPHELRGDADTLPDVEAWDARGLKAFQEAMKEHQHTEELRLGYVTFTRPRSLLLGSGHWWGPSQKRPRGPSDFLQALHDHCAAGHGEIEAWADEPEEDAENPALHERRPTTPGRSRSTTRPCPPPRRRRDRPGPPGGWPLARGRAAAAPPTPRAHPATTRTGRHRRTTRAPVRGRRLPGRRPPRTTALRPDEPRRSRRGHRRLGLLVRGPPRTVAGHARAGAPARDGSPRRAVRTPAGTPPRPASPPRKPAPSPPGTATWTPSPGSSCGARARVTDVPCPRR